MNECGSLEVRCHVRFYVHRRRLNDLGQAAGRIIVLGFTYFTFVDDFISRYTFIQYKKKNFPPTVNGTLKKTFE